MDWVICFFFFLLFFLSGTNWKPLLQRRISNTQEPSLVFFFFNVNCQRCCSPKNEKKNQGKKKSENKDFYQSGYLLTAKKETPKSLSSTDPLLLLFWRSKFSNGRAERERERETELFTILLLSDCGSGSGNGNGRGEYVTGGTNLRSCSSIIWFCFLYFSFHVLDNGDKNNKYGMSFLKIWCRLMMIYGWWLLPCSWLQA